MILGIDYGATTTDAVAVEKKKVVKKISLPSIQHHTIYELKEKLSIHPEKIAVTGGKEKKYSNATRINEIQAIGYGGAFLAKKEHCIVASLGTGTCIVHVNKNKIEHGCGTGVGGGTILGLSTLLTQLTDIHQLNALAQKGTVKDIDIIVGDIIGKGIGRIPATVTASNFGKAAFTTVTKSEDLILATMKLVAEPVAMLIIMAALYKNEDSIVLTGKVTQIPTIVLLMKEIFKVYNKRFIIPQHADVATAVGAAMCLP